MNRFLKKEWDDTEIPAWLRRQAREDAWNRLHPARTRRLPRFAWSTAGLALIAGLVFLILDRSPADLDPAETTPVATIRPETDAVPNVIEEAKPIPEFAPEEIAAAEPAPPPPPTSESPDRIVMNFVLPKTGVKMIWVMDRDFQIEGEKE